jgi:molecular chaperone DnaJ
MTAVKHDYYQLLGVSREADAETIRKAFGAAVKACDAAASDSPDAEDRIRELKEAYGVLSRPESRLLYDRYGYRGRTSGGVDEAHWEAREPSAHGEDVHQELVLRSFETSTGAWRLITFEAAQTCPECDGSGSAAEPDPNCPACGGTGRYAHRPNSDADRLEVERCPVCAPEQCAQCGGSGRVDELRRLSVQVPPGIESGEQLRVAGEGNAAPRGGVPGDLLLDVTVLRQPHESRFVRYVALLLLLAAVAVLYVSLHK